MDSSSKTPNKKVQLILADKKPYLISDDELSSDSDQELAFLIGKKWSIGCFDDLLGHGIKEVKKIEAEPEKIGWICRHASSGIDSGDAPSQEWLTSEQPIDKTAIKEIIEDNGGECELEMTSTTEPKLKEGKVIIHY